MITYAIAMQSLLCYKSWLLTFLREKYRSFFVLTDIGIHNSRAKFSLVQIIFLVSFFVESQPFEKISFNIFEKKIKTTLIIKLYSILYISIFKITCGLDFKIIIIQWRIKTQFRLLEHAISVFFFFFKIKINHQLTAKQYPYVTIKLTVSIFVSMSGGSTSLATDSMKTKKAITIKKRPLIKPERISTRPYLKDNISTWKQWTSILHKFRSYIKF